MKKSRGEKIEISAKVLGAVLKTNLRIQKANAELKELLSELLERPGLAKENLTVKQVKDEYGISRKQLDGFRKKGLKVIQKKPNGTIWVKRSEIDKFLMKK
ncbi:hypothetical protein R1T16_13115 [Flavobacterium sp. DG1-102-2]|uniref:hypothetical protein n=1 Tax=Flavobacterium sp. DG1-102-2 TaxID=3081663 RepID=UPI0029497D32|nr:hypothetical protein [Flavobacterium sp. DG1-102-2]MDV6169369.1 hypothetical protein [Flavobacterium sp. DG1-102-2]